MGITEEMKKQLLAPLPAEAITQHPTKTYLSSIKGIYITERLNEVFGIGQWQIRTEFIKDYVSDKADKNNHFPIMVVTKTTLEIPAHNVYYECFGGNDNEDMGDAFKGATTDAISKIGSFLGIGIDIYKGKKKTTPKGVQDAEGDPFEANAFTI